MADPAYRSPLRRTGTAPGTVALGVRRQWRARLLRVLGPPVWTAGGFVSSELLVRVAPGRYERPDVCASSARPPVDGLTGQVPELVVLVPGGDTGLWLAAGASQVWSLAPTQVRVHRRDGVSEACGLDHLTLPHPFTGGRVAVETLLAADLTRPQSSEAAGAGSWPPTPVG